MTALVEYRWVFYRTPRGGMTNRFEIWKQWMPRLFRFSDSSTSPWIQEFLKEFNVLSSHPASELMTLRLSNQGMLLRSLEAICWFVVQHFHFALPLCASKISGKPALHQRTKACISFWLVCTTFHSEGEFTNLNSPPRFQALRALPLMNLCLINLSISESLLFFWDSLLISYEFLSLSLNIGSGAQRHHLEILGDTCVLRLLFY